MGSAWQRVCVPLEVESISLHRSRRSAPRSPRRAGLLRRLAARVQRVGQQNRTSPPAT